VPGAVAPSSHHPGETGVAHVRRYEVRGERGRGGFGTVYAGWDSQLERAVAIKVRMPGA